MDVIVTHGNADFDALASLVAAKKIYPHAHVVLPSLQERSVRDFVAMIKGAVSLEPEQDIDLSALRRLIIVDTRSVRRIGRAAEAATRRGVTIFCYDHHPRQKGDVRAQRDVFRPYGATVTLLLEIIKRRKIPISPLEATIFAMGIYEDTGSLTFQTTTKKDIDMVSFLFGQGAKLSVISSYLSREMNNSEMHLLSSMLEATKIYRIGGIPVAMCAVPGTDPGVDVAWVTHKLLEIENVNVMVTLVQRRDNIQIVARSRLPAVNIGKLMQGLGGGGHASAASAAVRNARLPDLEQVVLDSLRRNIKATLTARSIMTTAVKTLPAAKPVAEARELLEQQGIGTIPVVENNKLIGMVSRHDLDHALRSGYGHSPVKGYLHCPAITATLQTSIQELEKIIIENNIGVIPVLSRGKLVGVVSRTDVFNATHHHLLGGGGIPKGPSPQRKPKNLRKLLKDVLRGRIYRLLKTISAHAESRQVRAYLVGGCVRDLLLGRKNFDLDIVVETNGIEYAPDLARVVKGTVRLHRRFKTAKITLADGLVIDVATARTESYEYPAALPVVASSSLRIDLSRRDFTINTLALGLNRKNFGDLLDFFDAEKDLRDKRIRVLHDLSFIEDPTRILRAVRFEQRFDFFIDRHTENLIRAAVDLNMFGRLHTFRIGDELRLILSEPDPLKVIRRMGQLHELKFIHPTLKFNRSMAELLDAVDTGLGWYERTFREKPELSWLVYLLAILDTLRPREIHTVFKHFELRKREHECIRLVKKQGPRVLAALLRMKTVRPSLVYRLLRPLPVEMVIFLMSKVNLAGHKEKFMHFLEKHASITLKMSGNDLKRLGPVSGPQFKKVLEKTLYAKIDGRLSTKAQELAFAKKLLCS